MELKVCLNCKQTFEKRENENNYRYTRRKYCSQKCYKEYMKTNKMGWYSNGSWPVSRGE